MPISSVRSAMKTFGRALTFLFILTAVTFLLPTNSHAQTTVTGNIINPGGSPTSTNAFIRFRLRNFSGTAPRTGLSGTGVCLTGAIVPQTLDVHPNSSGAISLTICGNDVIIPLNTYYTVEFWANGVITAQFNFIISGPAFNVNTANPIATSQNPLADFKAMELGLHCQTQVPPIPSMGTDVLYDLCGDRNLYYMDETGRIVGPLGNANIPPNVSSLNGLSGAITLAAGMNISLTPSGNTISIASTGGSVNSVGLTVPSTFTIGNSPITGTGNMALGWNVTTADQLMISNAMNSVIFEAAPQCLDTAGQHWNYNTATHTLFCGTSSSGGGGASPGGSTGDIQTNNGSGGFNGGTQLSVLAKKPNANSPICYASYYGNDTNDGLSWGAAKADIMACYDQLPAGGGTINISDGGSQSFPIPATTTAGQGIWICGPNDTVCQGSPPTGWRSTQKAVTFYGASGSNGTTVYIAAGSQADNNHPAIWLSGTNASITFENLSYEYPNVGIRLGCNSSGNCSDGTGGTTGVTFRNIIGHINQVAGGGPNVFVGSNSFWDLFDNCGFQGNAAEQVTATLVRSNNTVTATTSSPFTVTSIEHFGIQDAGISQFNGSFSVASVTNSTHFTYAQDGPNTTTAGVIITDKQIPLVEDPGTTGTGSGLIFIDGQSNGNVWSMGGARMWPGINGGGLYVRGMFTVEGDFAHYTAPAVWVGGAKALPISVGVENIEMADTIGTINPSVEIDCVTNPCLPYEFAALKDQIVVNKISFNNPTIGPHSGNGSVPTDATMSPLRNGFAGTAFGRLVGQTDAARRLGTLTASPNGAITLADSNPQDWTTFLGGGTITGGQLAPDGNTAIAFGAASATQTSGSGILIIPTFIPSPAGGSPGPSLAANSIYVIGIWIKNNVGGPTFVTNANGYGSANDCNSSGLQTVLMQPLNYTDGQWQYLTAICKLTKADTTIDAEIHVPITAGTNTVVYQPVLYGFAAGAISDNEAYEIMNNLSGPGFCNTGELCGALPINTNGYVSATGFKLKGSSSGVVSILPQAAAGTYNFNVPTTPGTAGQALLSGGGGGAPMTWGTAGSAFSGGLGTSYQDASEIAVPGNPSAGNDRLFLNSTTHTLQCLTSGGGNCLPSSGTVTSVNTTSTIGIISASGCSYTTSGTCTLSISGTSGGIPYFNSASSLASSGLLALNGVMLGGGVGSAPTSTAADATSTHVLCAGSPPSFCAITTSMVPTLNQNTTGSAATWTTARLLAGNSVNGSANVPFANKFIVQGTTDTGLSAAQFLGALGTGILKNTTTTGVLSLAISSDVISLWTGTCSSTTFLRGDGACTGGVGGTVTSVNTTVPGGIFSASGCSYTTSGTCAISLTGTSGGIPYFSDTATLSSSGLLPLYGVLLGGGAGATPTSTAADSNTAHVLLGGSPPTFGAITAGMVPTLNQNTTGSAATWTTARLLAGNSIDGSANVAFANKFIVQGTTDTGLSGAQFLGALGTGILKNTTTTGVLSLAASADVISLWTGTCSSTTFLEGDGVCATPSGAGNVSNTGTPTNNQLAIWTSSTVLKGVTALPAGNMPTFTGDVTNSGLAMTVVAINGTSMAGLATGILKNTTTTGVPSIAVAADFPTLNQSTTGNAATATTTGEVNGASIPASKTIVGTNGSSQIIDATAATLSNNTTGSAAKWTTARNLAGNSVDGSANVAFANAFIVQGTTDAGLSGAQFLGALATGIVKNTTSTGILSIAVAADFPTLNQNTSGTAANLSGTPALPNGTSATSQTTTDNTTKLSTDAFVQSNISLPSYMASATAGDFGCLVSGVMADCTAGFPTNPQSSSTYAITCGPGDLGHIVKRTNTTTAADTILQANTSCFTKSFYFIYWAAGTANIVLTATTSTFTCTGAGGQCGSSTLTLQPGSFAEVVQDGANYDVFVSAAAGNTGTVTVSSSTTGTASLTFANAPTCVITPTGDPTAVGVYWVTATSSILTAHVKSSGTITFNYNCQGEPN